MSLDLPMPLTYLITSGETTKETAPSNSEFVKLLELVRRAVAARVSLVQLREKCLTSQTLYELAERAAAITRGSSTRLLVNDRADIARAAGCDGVHLTSQSLEAQIVRRTFGMDFLIGVSTHSIDEARAAHAGGADFVVFGPVFDTPSKRAYGEPLGLELLRKAARELHQFPIIAIGGISAENARSTIDAGAAGVAAIRLFAEARDLDATMRALGLSSAARINLPA